MGPDSLAVRTGGPPCRCRAQRSRADDRPCHHRYDNRRMAAHYGNAESRRTPQAPGYGRRANRLVRRRRMRAAATPALNRKSDAGSGTAAGVTLTSPQAKPPPGGLTRKFTYSNSPSGNTGGKPTNESKKFVSASKKPSISVLPTTEKLSYLPKGNLGKTLEKEVVTDVLGDDYRDHTASTHRRAEAGERQSKEQLVRRANEEWCVRIVSQSSDRSHPPPRYRRCCYY